MKQFFIAGLGTVMLFLTGCGDKESPVSEDNTAAIEVKVNSVSEANSRPYLTASGKIEAVNSANLSTRMMGYIDNISVNVGDTVRKGQLLMSINNADISAKLAQVNAGIAEATAAFSNAEKDFNRFTNLFKENSASQKELDDITANYNIAKARLEGAVEMKNEVNAQLSYVKIRAPFNGVVTNKFIKKGDMAHPGNPLLEIEVPGSFQVLAMVPESEILKIQMGSKAIVTLKTTNQTVEGTVTEVSTSAKNTGGQYLVKIVLEKTDARVLTGMYANVQFPVVQEATFNSVMIPRSALVTRGQLTGVYTVSQSNTALLRWLRLGRSIDDQVEVLSGLAANEQYIVSAEGKLFNGVKISIQ